MLDELYYLRERARQMASRGHHDEAVSSLLSAAQHTQVAESDYVSVLRPLEQAFAQRGDARNALTVSWYLALSGGADFGRALGYLSEVPHGDRARTFAAAGDMAQAAREMENSGSVAAAAIYREKALDWQGARALWSRLTQVQGGDAGAYNAALIQFNLARCAKQCQDPRQTREAIVAAVHLLEEAADHFESVGQRERAFDCFQVLVQIGREGGMFEDILEGFVNCIRILREDHLKYFALQYFEDALAAATERQEFSAAATLAREAAEYARALGLTATAGHYAFVQADLWRKVAQQQLARGAPPEIAENALLAAVVPLGELGQFARVGSLYAELAMMDLDPSRKAHYTRASKRYVDVRDELLDSAPLPSHLRQENHFPEVWHVDLIEWEQRGSAAEACADIVLNRSWPDSIRRKAMLARLTALHAESPDARGGSVTGARVKLAEQLAQLQLYAVLSPLEKLYAQDEKPVRLAVLAAMQTLFFKRSFVTVRAGLRDPDPAVVDQAARAVESLYFPHAFDPLSRIVREASNSKVRAAAIRALAHVDSNEAAEFLLGLLEHGAPSDRQATLHSLKRTRGARFVELARNALPTSSPDVQRAIREILGRRGIAS